MTEQDKERASDTPGDENKPPGPTDQGRTGGMATREVAPELVDKDRDDPAD